MKMYILVAFVSSPLLAGCLVGKGEDQACAQYCDLMEENCPGTGFAGGSTSHDRDECLDMCASYESNPVVDDNGEEVLLGDRVPDDDSLECRVYHANNASAQKDGVHCGHASPDGAGVCVEFKTACDQFCAGAPAEPETQVRPDGFGGVVEFCSMAEAGPAFEDIDACAAFCNGIPLGGEDDVAGRTRFCFLNRALEANETQNQSACPDLGPDTTVCTGG